MNEWFKNLLRTAVLVAAMVLPGTVTAGGDFTGVWQPYSDPVMTVTPHHLSFERGTSARLEPVRSDGSVFHVISTKGDALGPCKGGTNEYVAFHLLDNGLLAFMQYSADKLPAEPAGSNSREVTRNGACSVMFYTR